MGAERPDHPLSCPRLTFVTPAGFLPSRLLLVLGGESEALQSPFLSSVSDLSYIPTSHHFSSTGPISHLSSFVCILTTTYNSHLLFCHLYFASHLPSSTLPSPIFFPLSPRQLVGSSSLSPGPISLADFPQFLFRSYFPHFPSLSFPLLPSSPAFQNYVCLLCKGSRYGVPALPYSRHPQFLVLSLSIFESFRETWDFR